MALGEGVASSFEAATCKRWGRWSTCLGETGCHVKMARTFVRLQKLLVGSGRGGFPLWRETQRFSIPSSASQRSSLRCGSSVTSRLFRLPTYHVPKRGKLSSEKGHTYGDPHQSHS
jgi:hypothetical protein